MRYRRYTIRGQARLSTRIMKWIAGRLCYTCRWGCAQHSGYEEHTWHHHDGSGDFWECDAEWLWRLWGGTP